MRSIEYINKIEDPDLVAKSLGDLLGNGDNVDIALEFPNLIRSLSPPSSTATHVLESMRASHELGEHEVFVISVGSLAVGMSVVSRQIVPPEGVSEEAPNLSGFICRPYRGIGLGRLSLEKRLEAVEDHFNGIAWTSVHIDNSTSNHLIESVGFNRFSTTKDRHIYTYGIKKSP